MSGIVLHIDLADKKFVRGLGVFVIGNVQGYSPCLIRKHYGAPATLMEFCECLENSELLNFLPIDVKDKNFATVRNCKILGNLLDRVGEKG